MKAEIEQLLYDYFELQYQAMAGQGFDGMESFFSERERAQGLMEIAILRLMLDVQRAEMGHYNYVEYDFRFSSDIRFTPGIINDTNVFVPLDLNWVGVTKEMLDDSDFEDDAPGEIYIEVDFYVTLEYIGQHSFDMSPEDPSVSRSGLNHSVVVEKNEGVWEIYSHEIHDRTWESFGTKNSTIQELIAAHEEALASREASRVKLHTPDSDTLLYDPLPILEWHSFRGAEEYELSLYDSSGEHDMLIHIWTVDSNCYPYCEFRIPPEFELAFGEYKWCVRAMIPDDWSGGVWSKFRTFTFGPGVTLQINPEDGFTTSDTTPTFEWSSVPGAELYVLEIKLLDDTLVKRYQIPKNYYCKDDGNCEWKIFPNTLEPATTYKWHIRAKTGKFLGKWSHYREFTTQ